MRDFATPYLRPAFTQALAERLLNGASLNLTGPHGHGRRRTLRDLRHCLPASLRVLQANLRRYPQDLAVLLNDLSTQGGCKTTEHLGTLLDALARRGGKTLLILHNFDELQTGEESGYDDRFFAQLNDIRGRPNLSLLCVSERVHDEWPLRDEEMRLPPLTGEQIIAELRRRGVAEPELWQIADRLRQEQAPYTALDTLHPEA